MINYEKYFGIPKRTALSLSNEEMYSKFETWTEKHSLISAINTLEFCILEWLQEEVDE